MWSWILNLLYPKYYQNGGSKTVRYAFPIMAITALFAGLASVSSQDSSYITITTDPATVENGELFTIEVKAFAHTPINAVDIVVKYPDDQIEVEGIDTGTSVITLWAVEPYAENGEIYLRGGVFQRGFLGEHVIARIKARATQTGMAYVNVDSASLVAGDGRGSEIPAERVSQNETKITVLSKEGALTSEIELALITDIDGDGNVDLSDLSDFMAAWFTRGKTYDFNSDGKMTFKDFSILLADSFSR